MTVTKTGKTAIPRAPRINGISADAKVLGVTREHLFLVLRGKRKSPPLQARYTALKESQKIEHMDKSRIPESPDHGSAAAPESPQRVPMPIELAALQNLQPSYFKSLERLGLDVLIVRFEAGKDSPIWQHNTETIAAALENELVLLKAAGEPVSSLYPLGAQFHVYQVTHPKFGAAVRRFKDFLGARGLLEITKIFHAESAELLRQWYPGTAAALSGSLLAHAWNGDTLILKDA